MLEIILYSLVTGLALGFGGGPIFFVVLETSIAKNRGRAFSIASGAALADVVFMALVYFGSVSFLSSLDEKPWVVSASGVALAGFGLYYILRSGQSDSRESGLQIARKRLFVLKGFLINILNLGVLFFWISATVAVQALLGDEAPSIWIYYALSLVFYLSLELVKVSFAQRFKTYVNPRRLKLIQKLMGIGLICFGIFLILRQLFF